MRILILGRLLVPASLLAACAMPADPAKLLIAHRGASAYAPEHTLEAYRLAIEQGADFVEQDLQATSDGVLICLHDLSLERTTDVEQRFPDRAREIVVDGRPRKVWPASDFTLEEIKTLDAGAWFDERYAGARIPTFQEAIDLIAGRAGLYPELKDPQHYAQLGVEMERLAIAALRENGLDGPSSETPVILQSFDSETLQKLKFELNCRLPLVLLIGEESRQLLGDAGLQRASRFATGIGPAKGILMADPSLVQRAHARGLTVTPYTFRSSRVAAGFADVSAEMRHYLYGLSVDALFTDNPDLFPRQ